MGKGIMRFITCKDAVHSHSECCGKVVGLHAVAQRLPH